jgi:hypothetical protein
MILDTTTTYITPHHHLAPTTWLVQASAAPSLACFNHLFFIYIYPFPFSMPNVGHECVLPKSHTMAFTISSNPTPQLNDMFAHARDQRRSAQPHGGIHLLLLISILSFPRFFLLHLPRPPVDKQVVVVIYFIVR